MRLTGHLICRGTLTIINKKGHLQMQVTLSLCYEKDTRSQRAIIKGNGLINRFAQKVLLMYQFPLSN